MKAMKHRHSDAEIAGIKELERLLKRKDAQIARIKELERLLKLRDAQNADLVARIEGLELEASTSYGDFVAGKLAKNACVH